MAYFTNLESKARKIQAAAAKLKKKSTNNEVQALSKMVEELAAVLAETNETLKDKK